TIAEIGSQTLLEAFNRYGGGENEDSKISNDSGRFYTDIASYSKDGLEWLVITAIPENIFISAIYDNMKFILYLTILSVILSLFVYLKLTSKFLRPINNLKTASEKLALGDLAQRAEIIRNDEIGDISDSFNKMADTISTLINGLETKVRERTAELENSNTALEENSEMLRITLFSVGYGFISTDQFGNIVTINNVAEILTGWYQDEAIGKPFEEVFNIINKDNGEKCASLVKEVFESRKIIAPEQHTILVSKDSTETSVEVSAALISNEKEKMFGVVIAFRDCTVSRDKQSKIEYLSYHDSLTGLYNRRFYDEELRRLDTDRNLPIALIMLDVNGLKLINDAFGHKAGDLLLKRISNIMKRVCRNDEIITKIGGDEFIILLPKTDLIAANKLIARMRDVINKEKIDNIILSASMGCAVKLNKSQNIDEVFKEAEDDMYRRKLSESASMRSKNIDLIINSLFEKSSTETTHSKRVGEICESIAKNMDFQVDKLIQMRTAGLMHDIGKINIEDNVLNRKGKLQDNDWSEIKRHPEIGYR
ncbi:MAG: diguanylate cyclase, partial [Actinomycetota bacterium]